MAEPRSKTARQAVQAGRGSGGGLTFLGDHRYLVPLNNGKHAYVRNLTTGKTKRLKTTSDAFAEEIKQLVEAGHGAKVRGEFDQLAKDFPTHGWDDTAKRLVEAEVFDS
ncbi:MAG: hypothetical protein GEV07_20770 [Streptosporangiales bacterium]|nr:hypothetical protein [Streptosporangiales bacterium]